MRIRQVYDNDDIESLDIDIDRILSDGTVKTTERDPRIRELVGQNELDSQRQSVYNGSLGTEEFEQTSISRMWLSLGIAQYFPEKKTPFQEPRRAIDPPEDLILRNHYGEDDVSTTLTEDILYRTSKSAEKIKLGDDDHDRHTDETVKSSDETEPGTIWYTFGKQYRYAAVLGVLLLFIICGLGVALESLDKNTTKSSSHDSDDLEEAWAVRPTLPPFWKTREPTSSPSASATLQPTHVPTKAEPVQETGEPSPGLPIWDTRPSSPAPTRSGQSHLLELLTYSTSEKTIEAISTMGTAQQKAYEWLSKDPSYFTHTASSKIQRFSLAVLYFATVDESTFPDVLESWLDYDTHECSWFMSSYEYRVPCGSDGIFKYLALRNVNLAGKLPSELGLLSNLVALVFNDNALTGTIPKEFGEWASLETLDLHGNGLSGRLPDWKNVPNLKEINLSLNMLTGYVPANIGSLDITTLDFRNNPNLVGVIPFELCSNQIDMLAADCDLVYCSCCTQCNFNETTAPSRAPRPISTPAARPTSPPPTAKRTPAPTRLIFPLEPTTQCIDKIQASKQCYDVGEPIDVFYSNCNPTFTDWIGIYGISTPENALMDPLLSQRTCVHWPCTGDQQHSTIAIDESARGSSIWPLPSGRYVVFMLRGGSYVGPHTVVAKTLFITVSDNFCM